MKIAFVGFGGVGQSLAKLLVEQKRQLIEDFGFEPVIVAVSDVMKGAVYDPKGLDIPHLLEVLDETGNMENYFNTRSKVVKGLNSLETITGTNAEVIVEVTYTNVKTGQPAIDHCKAAFENKKSLVTTNKGPVALLYQELGELAAKNDVFWGFEGTVMSGTPALRMPVSTLAGNDITEIKGILNGTTNYILTEMEAGSSYENALAKAQELGYAEADPTSDVEGYDARYKAVILSNYLMGGNITPDDVACQGISGITVEKMEEVKSRNKTIRLLARIKKANGKITAKVQPEELEKNDPLASVQGPTNGILYKCNLAGPIFLTGAGAGLRETAYSLLIDLINYQREKRMKVREVDYNAN
ncbi:homoserine dehydrogenase [Evansella tamaricis]|uniref:Homoserine dehydrogenase n=1 Tax=Evansella tamaricis TaxID=2069301 RepID=A0ABS6JJN8_9BACI|nr:homoserine dehydrogenase [Evansella tamaricis]MBU9713801.1 homoserine dehydrogenase [Evansella tamaricis]